MASMSTASSLSLRARALVRLAQRGLSTPATTSSKQLGAAGKQFGEAELAAAVAASAKTRDARPGGGAQRGLTQAAAQFAATTNRDLAMQVERQLNAQMAAFSEPESTADQAMSAAAQHLQGIPLKSKREYKSLMASYNAKRG